MQRAAPPAAGAEALRQHATHSSNSSRRKCPVADRRARTRSNSASSCHSLRGHLGGDLLRQHVERIPRDAQPVELAAPHGIEQRRALDQLVARQTGTAGPWRCRRPMPGASHALQEGVDRSASSRSGTRDPHRRCRCRARARRSPPAPSARRASGAARRRGAAPWQGCRDARRHSPRPARSDRCRATRSASRRVLTNTSVVRCSRMSSASRS